MLNNTLNHPKSLTRIGVFYDGNYFLHVSNYYNYVHPKRSRISINGLHEFIRHRVAKEEGTDVRLCQIVDAHYFRGRLSASEASQRTGLLYFERVFDDILMSEGVTTHYLPVRQSFGRKFDKGIDLWLALEAYELAFYKQFSVLVIIGSDSDYVPLARKLNTLGVRVMVIGWDYDYTDEDGTSFVTRTSQDLLAEVTYPIAMHKIIDDEDNQEDDLVAQLFVPRSTEKKSFPKPALDDKNGNSFSTDTEQLLQSEDRVVSTIKSVKEGYGFINYPPNNVFFHYTSLLDYDFNDLSIGDQVQFTLEQKEDGRLVAKDILVVIAS